MWVVLRTRRVEDREKGWQEMPDDLSREDGVQEAHGTVATAVRELLGGVRQGEPVHAGALTLIPLLPATETVTRQTGYLPLAEALRLKQFTVTEQAQAQVPELLATSTADAPVVLVGGEQVIGGLQNRVLNTTILVAAHAAQKIPVTCVEAGRWHEVTTPTNVDESTPSAGDTAPTPSAAQEVVGEFRAEEAAYSKLRKMHAKSVTASLASGRGHQSDQGAVWGEVSARMAVSGSYSPSSAMDTLYKTPERANKLQETVAALSRPEGALGFVALMGSEVLGAELFADESLADAYWERLARSYAVEALDAGAGTGDGDQGDQGDQTQPDDAAKSAETRLLEEALTAEIQVHPSPGLGEDARLVSSQVSGAGLVYDGAVVHLSLFPENADDHDSSQQGTQRQYGGHRQSYASDGQRADPNV